MIRCLWAAPSRLPLAIICSQIFWPRLRVYPLATIHCQYSFGRHNKSVFHCHFGRACLPQDFVVAIATLLHRRLHVPSRRIVILPFLRLRHCALAGLFLPITRQAYPGHMYCAETLDLCLCTGIVGITPNYFTTATSWHYHYMIILNIIFQCARLSTIGNAHCPTFLSVGRDLSGDLHPHIHARTFILGDVSRK